MNYPSSCILLLLVIVAAATAFTPSTLSAYQQGTFSSSTSSLFVLYDPRTSNDEFVDFPTPAQKTALKKEASKRQARNELATVFLPQEETMGPFSEDTLKDLWNALQENGLVQIRGISKDNKKYAFNTAERLCAELEMIQQELQVTLLSMKGHSVVLFSPTLSSDHPLYVTLRTSVGQKNTWQGRVKAPRDHRGQIIKEE
jgi:hypothetical protein